MLNQPRDGWAWVELGNFKGITSYIDDVPFIWLRSCLQALKDDTPLALHVNGEVAHSYLVITSSGSYAILAGGEGEEFMAMKGAYLPDVARELVGDIRAHFEDWVEWYADEDEEILARRWVGLEALLKAVEAELEEWNFAEEE